MLSLSIVAAVFIVIHQAQASESVQKRDLAYQQQVNTAIASTYGLTATNPGNLPIADHESLRADLVSVNGAPGAVAQMCTIATGSSPAQVTVTCP